MAKPVGADYINEKRRNFSLYVLQDRAIPAISDGLKPASRRVLWTARDGKKVKSATLSGATMPIHPHAAPDSTINTLAAKYGNNVPLLDGIGAFGTQLLPTEYGATRYTSVKVSEFTKDCMFKDIEIIPMIENYDSTLLEPEHFLPLVPISLLNPASGIAIGYACTILPRTLQDVILAQLTYLAGGDFDHLTPTFTPFKNKAEWDVDNHRWLFKGEFERINSSMLKIIKLPYGLTHNKFAVSGIAAKRSKLDKLLDDNIILDYEDHSKDTIDVRVKFKRGELTNLSDDQILNMFGLTMFASENLNLVGFDGDSLLSSNDKEVIKLFTDWRLTWYPMRYERLKSLLSVDIQKYRDVITAIDNDAGKVASTKQNKQAYQEWLTSIGVVHDDYVSTLPTYRYTLEERKKFEDKLSEALLQLDEYNQLLGSDKLRKNVYIRELKEILKKYG